MKLFNSEQRIIYVVTGKGDNGKSLYMAYTAYKNLELYKRWYKKNVTEVPRHIALNIKTMRLAPWVEKKFGIWPKGFIEYYEELSQIPTLKQCDVFFDEMGNNFNSRRWSDMPQDIIDWFATLGHNEIFIYGSAQNFLDIDVIIRRKVQNIIALTKLCGSPRPGKSLPPVKKIWGVILKHYVHYTEMEKEEWKRTEDSWPRPFCITKFRCSLYDTLQKIQRSDLPRKKCLVRYCDNPNHKDRFQRPWKEFVHI